MTHKAQVADCVCKHPKQWHQPSFTECSSVSKGRGLCRSTSNQSHFRSSGFPDVSLPRSRLLQAGTVQRSSRCGKTSSGQKDVPTTCCVVVCWVLWMCHSGWSLTRTIPSTNPSPAAYKHATNTHYALALTHRYLRKCVECGGFFPWVSWKLFLTSTAAPGNGGRQQSHTHDQGSDLAEKLAKLVKYDSDNFFQGRNCVESIYRQTTWKGHEKSLPDSFFIFLERGAFQSPMLHPESESCS